MVLKKVLITGIAGSGGSYLAEYIVENHPDVEVHGIARWHSTTAFQNLSSIQDKIKRIISKGFMLQQGLAKFPKFYLMPGMGEKCLHRFRG